MGFFKFDYVDESELAVTQTESTPSIELTPGDASFKIIGVYDCKKDGTPLTTKNGTPKLNVSFSVKDSRGQTGIVYEDLTANTAWKIKALLDAIGLGALYDPSGTLNPDDLTGYSGKCKIGIKKSDGYPDRMSVERFYKAESQIPMNRKPLATNVPEDDLPF